jgi:hypothetical protein
MAVREASRCSCALVSRLTIPSVEKTTCYPLFALWIPMIESIPDIATQILKARSGESRKLLTNLVSLRMESYLGGEEGT